jgi:hypothetical protein
MSLITAQSDGIWALQGKALESGQDLINEAKSWLSLTSDKTQSQWIETYISKLQRHLKALKSLHQETIQASMVMWKKMWDPEKRMYVPLAEYVVAPEGAEQISPRNNYNMLGDPNKYGSSNPDSWKEIRLAVTKNDMEVRDVNLGKSLDHNQNLNFFFGPSRQGEMDASAHFANEFMSKNTEIRISMLARKVGIRRQWLKPETLKKSKDFYRSDTTKFMVDDCVLAEEIVNNLNLQEDIKSCTLPCYPVSFLLAKDITIRMNFDFEKTESIYAFAKSIASSGGNFFCFGSNEDAKQIAINIQAGELEIKFSSPQIIGYYLQISPPDQSIKLELDEADNIGNAISFLETLKDLHIQSKSELDIPDMVF